MMMLTITAHLVDIVVIITTLLHPHLVDVSVREGGEATNTAAEAGDRTAQVYHPRPLRLITLGIQGRLSIISGSSDPSRFPSRPEARRGEDG